MDYIERLLFNWKEKKEKENWYETYWFIDIHGTLIKPTYKTIFEIELYLDAEDVMRYLTRRDDIILIMYTCSHTKEIQRYIEELSEYGILFNHINNNPEVKNTVYGDYTKKPYYDILFDDKAGFYPEKDWTKLKKILKI